MIFRILNLVLNNLNKPNFNRVEIIIIDQINKENILNNRQNV